MSNGSGEAAGGLALLAIAALCCGGSSLARASYHGYIAECTIVDKDRGHSSDSSSSHYRVYTAQCGTLANEDDLFLTKLDSGDIQGRLERGHTYRLRIVGWRSPARSHFPNIAGIESEVAK